MGGKKGKKGKSKQITLPLGAFLGACSQVPQDAIVVSAPKVKYDDDDREGEVYGSEQIVLPTCPRTSRGPHVDPEKIPTEAPFTAHVANLPFEVDDEEITSFFREMKVLSVRLPMDRDGSRAKGYGYVEFATRADLIEAMGMHEEQLRGRKIRVDLPENEGAGGDRGGRDGGRRERGGWGDRERGEDREERSQGVSDWRSAPAEHKTEARDERKGGGGFERGGGSSSGGGGGGFGDREGGDRGGRFGGGGGRYDDDRRGGFSSDRPARGDDEPWRRGGDRPSGGGSDRPSGFSDRFSDRDRGSGGGGGSFGDRDRGSGGGGFGDRDRGSSGFGDRDRGSGFGDRDRGSGFGDRDRGSGFSDRDRGSGFGDRDRGSSSGGGFGDRDRGDRGGGGFDRMERRGGGGDDGDSQKERPRLQLKPRSAPAASPTGTEDAKGATPSEAAPSAAESSGSIFGSAKPVDTTTRELEIENKFSNVSTGPKREAEAPSKASSADIFGAARPVDTSSREQEIEQKIRKSPNIVKKEAPKPSAVDIFGSARPVDTTSREREIEEKLRKGPSSGAAAGGSEAPPKADTWRDRDRPAPRRDIDRRDDRRTDGGGGGYDRRGDGYDRRTGDSGYDRRDGGGYDRGFDRSRRDDRFGGGGGGDRGGGVSRDDRFGSRISKDDAQETTRNGRSNRSPVRSADHSPRNGVASSRKERPANYDSDEERFKKAQPKGNDAPKDLNMSNKFGNLDLEEELA